MMGIHFFLLVCLFTFTFDDTIEVIQASKQNWNYSIPEKGRGTTYNILFKTKYSSKNQTFLYLLVHGKPLPVQLYNNKMKNISQFEEQDTLRLIAQDKVGFSTMFEIQKKIHENKIAPNDCLNKVYLNVYSNKSEKFIEIKNIEILKPEILH